MIDELDSPTREPGDDAALREGNGQPMSSPTESAETAGVPANEPLKSEASVDLDGGELEVGESEVGEMEVGEMEVGESEVGESDVGESDVGESDVGESDVGESEVGGLGIGVTSRRDERPAAESTETDRSERAEVETDAAEATGPAESPGEFVPEPELSGEAGMPPAKPKKARTPGKPVEEAPLEEAGKKEWFILKVQSNREDSIADALQRRIAIAGLERFFDEIIVPIEKVSEFKNGKKRVVKRKIYPGYIVVHMELNDDTWFLVRETPGIGDFTGSGGKPTPMSTSDVNKIVSKQEDKPEEQITVDVRYKSGDRVRINEGTFENFEGDVDSIDAVNGRVTVMINIFGRSTPVELETWQVETL